MNQVGVCIVTRFSREVIFDCLTSLLDQAMALDLQIVVVDNASQDGMVDEVRLKFPAVKLVLNNENFGYSRAVNQGLKALDAKYYVLLNPDAIVLPGAIGNLYQFMEDNLDVGICGPKVLNRDGSIQYQSRRGEARPWEVFSYFAGLAKLFPDNPRFTGYLLNHINNDEVNDVKAVSGSCMMIRREVVQNIGYLDEQYFAYQEDTDYCFQARQAGWRVCYVPMAEVRHLGGRGGSAVSPYMGVYQWHRSYYLYYRKNLAKDYPFWFHPLYYFSMCVKFILNLVLLLFSRDKVVGTRKP